MPTQSVKKRGLQKRNAKPSVFKENGEEITNILKENLIDKAYDFHDHQIQAVLKTQNLFLDDERDRNRQLINNKTVPLPKPALIIAPTASGKSGMIVLLPFVLRAQKVLILTPSLVISEQLAAAFGMNGKRKCFFEDVGLIDGSEEERITQRQNYFGDIKIISHPNDLTEISSSSLFIVNAQKFGGKSKMSLVYRHDKIIDDVEKFFKQFDLLIVDEAHHYPAKTWDRIVKEFSKQSNDIQKKIVFLTATPYKNIKGNLAFILGEGEAAQRRVAFEICEDELVQGNKTRRCRFEEPRHTGTTSKVFSDIEKFLKENRKRERRIKPQAMILMRTKKDANKLVADLNTLAKTKPYATALLADKPQNLKEFTNGNFKVGVTCGVGKEGYDNANVTLCVILRRIVHGKILFSQFIGRCKRIRRSLEGPEPDKSHGIVLSYREFEQKKLWDDFDQKMADFDPIEVDDEN